MKIADRITNCIARVVGPSNGTVQLHAPSFSGNEEKYVTECIQTGWVSSAGSYVDTFERELAAYCGTNRAVAVCNGTAALHVCLLLAGVCQNEEVLMPSLTFIAAANACSYVGAVPHFVDVSKDRLSIDPTKLWEHLSNIVETRDGSPFNRHTGRRIACLLPMHAFGHPAAMNELAQVATEFGLVIVEDAAESLGSFYGNRHTGTLGDLGAVSFNGNKIITTGGGGAILTNDVEMGLRAKHLTSTAKLPSKWECVHDQIGFNFRMPNINAALGVGQLESLPKKLERKRRLAANYQEVFAELEEITFLSEPADSTSNYWLCTILIDESMDLREILRRTNAAGYETRPVWRPIHQLCIHDGAVSACLENTESLVFQVLNLPSGPELSE